MRSSRKTTSHTGGRTVRRTVAAVMLAGTLVVTSACGGDSERPIWHAGGAGGGAKGEAAPTAPAQPEFAAKVTEPADGATGVQPLTRISFATQEATEVAGVEVTDAEGKKVAGTLADDGRTWVPADALRWGKKYTTKVTVNGEGDESATTTSSFTVMAKPNKLVRISSLLGDDAVVGVGMPVIIRFGRPVPGSLRDDVQRRMTVTSTPRQEGIWHWVTGSEVHYRPKVFWQANTKISVEVASRGVPMGGGWFGGTDLTLRLKTGNAVVMTVDNKAKKMTVTRNGKKLRDIPISLGKKSTPSSSGTMIVMEKLRETVFDTFDELGPEEGYRTDIEYAQRLTWGGEFIHSAPWSVNDQGRRNVSHGCVNMSPANAKWLFGITSLGDPVTVKGTEVKLQNGNGWTDWNMSWEQYVKGSAIPYEG